METIHSDSQIEIWLGGLTQPESKRRESTCRAISKSPTFDTRIVHALEDIARDDPKGYAREAAKAALEIIAEKHHRAGADIRTFLEKLRTGELAQRIVPEVEAKPPQELQAQAFQPLPKPVVPEPVVPEPKPAAFVPPPRAEPTPRVAPIVAEKPAAGRAVSQPPKPSVPFDQWLLSERNIKLALYSGGFLLILAGLIFVGVNWAYLPGIAKLGVTLAVTLAMYAGGALLFRRSSLKIGGTALLAIASGFLPLNFVVTHLYLTGERGVSVETIWFVASLLCGAVYALTALRTRHNLFTVFMLLAGVSGVTAGMNWLALPLTGMAFGYAVSTLALLLTAYWTGSRAGTRFLARVLQVAAHLIAPVVFMFGAVTWILTFSNTLRLGNAWLSLGALALAVAFYALEDWRSHLLYARWGAAFAFALFAVFVCTQLGLSSIQTGLALMVLAAAYLIAGNFLRRGKKPDAGMPLYVSSALLALFVTAQSAVVFGRTPGHLALALVGDVVLLALAAYLSRRVEFVYAAAWLVLAPVAIYGSLYLTGMTLRALAFGAVMLLYTAIAFWIVPRQRQWALPFLSVAAFLSLLVPALLVPDYPVLTAMLVLIAGQYALMAVRMNLRWLVLPAIAGINLAILAGARLTFPFNIELARASAFAFCAWAVILYFARRAMLYVRLDGWALPLHYGAIANFGLTYALIGILSVNDLTRFGFLSQSLGVTLMWGVALFGLTAYLYRRVEFLYAAVWLLIAPAFLYARLYLGDHIRVGLALGVMMFGYAVLGYLLGRGRAIRERAVGAAGAFLSGAAWLSVIAPAVLFPDYAVMTALLTAIALLYAFGAVWLRWQWLTLAALVALNLALAAGVLSTFRLPVEVQRASAIGYAALGVVMVAGGVELKRRGLSRWRGPLYMVAAVDLALGYGLASVATEALFVAVSVVVSVVCFALQWVEKEALGRLRAPPVLTCIGALVVLNGIYFGTRVLNIQPEYALTTVAFGCAVLVGVALWLGGAQGLDTTANRLYGVPLRYIGLGGMSAMLVTATAFGGPFANGFTFGLAAVAFGADGFVRKQVEPVYAGGASLVAAIWWILRAYQVTEWQAYVIPFALLCLLIGWSELRRGRTIWFEVATVVGLGVLLATGFYQSLSNVNYAILLLVESAAAFGIGLKLRSRIYVEAGIVALLANGLAQFGPAFVELPRWVQIGTIGSILLVGGLIALFRRQMLLDARRELTIRWKLWKP